MAVVVLAMHRTGSSALSRVLNLLGCDVPKRLMGEHPSNETGHWESVEVKVLNDELLASGGSSWRDWEAFNPRWYETVRPLEFRPRALEVLREEFGASRLFVFKDPRVCRIFPFWRDTFAEAGIEPKVILTLRHPQEVAASLEKRNEIPAQQGLLLWLRHMLDAEAASRGMTRAVVQYDAMLATPVDVVTGLQEQLGLFWPRMSEQTCDEIRSFMKPDLRHHKIAPLEGFAEAQGFRAWLEQVYDILLRWSRYGEEVADYEALDQVRSKMETLSEPLREVMGALSAQARELARKSASVASLTNERHTMGNDLNAAQKTVSTLKEQQATLHAELEKSRAGQDEVEAETRALRSELEKARSLQDAKETEARTLRADLENARSGLGAAKGEMARLAEELSRRDEEIGNMQADLHSLRSMLEQRSHEAEQTAAALKEAQDRIGQQQQEAALLRSSLDEARSGLAAACTAGEADAARIAALRSEADAAQRALKDRERALTRLREKNAALDGEAATQAGDLAQMAQLILEKEEALKRRNAVAHEVEEDNAALRQDLTRLRQELEDRTRALAEAEAHRQALLDSTSWKISAPLRRLILLLKR